MKIQKQDGTEVQIEWQQLGYGEARSFLCGWCSAHVASERGFFGRDTVTSEAVISVHICHLCGKPSFFDERDLQHPQPAYGSPIQHLNVPEIRELVEEARRCLSSHAYTAAHWCCKKILILICRDRGQTQIQTTKDAIEYLKTAGHIPPALLDAAEVILKSVSQAGKLKLMNHSEALEIFQLTDIILRLIYELPATMKEIQAQAHKQDLTGPPQSHANQILNRLQKGYLK